MAAARQPDHIGLELLPQRQGIAGKPAVDGGYPLLDLIDGAGMVRRLHAPHEIPRVPARPHEPVRATHDGAGQRSIEEEAFHGRLESLAVRDNQWTCSELSPHVLHGTDRVLVDVGDDRIAQG